MPASVVITLLNKRSPLQPGVDIAGTTTFRRIASNITEIAFFITLWTDIWRSGNCDGVTTLLTLPKSQVAGRANIPDEFTRSSKTTQGTLHFSIFLLHFAASSFVWWGRTRIGISKHQSVYRNTAKLLINKKAESHFFKATRLSRPDPWLSAPEFLQVWLCLWNLFAIRILSLS